MSESVAVHRAWPGLIEAYRDRLPVKDDWKVVTLLEGGTPLIAAPHLSEITGCEVYLKVEGLNPTGSFKDRGVSTMITALADAGQREALDGHQQRVRSSQAASRPRSAPPMCWCPIRPRSFRSSSSSTSRW